MATLGVTGKSENADLFSALCDLYAQQGLPVVECGLPFPLLQIAEARVWRGVPPPAASDFKLVSAHLARLGLPTRETEAIVATTECLFRVMRPAELEIEARLPDLFSKLAGPLTFTADPDDVLVRAEFARLWDALEAEAGGGWVLAATRRPVWMTGRPRLFAYEICAAIVAERLILQSVPAASASTAAVELAAMLSDRAVDADEVRRWREQYRIVRVVQCPDQSSLTRHLAYPRAKFSAIGMQWAEEPVPLRGPWLTPADILENWRLPIATAAQVARMISRGPYKSDGREVRNMAACCLCDTDEVAAETIWGHLRESHGIADEDLQTDAGLIHDIRHRRTGEILAALRKGPPSPKIRNGRSRGIGTAHVGRRAKTS